MTDLVLEALKVLYDNSSDASERAVVSNYLSCFQRSLLSWNVTLNLLSRQDALPVVSQLFAAQTLKEKLRTQSYQLSQDSWQPVRSCIISVLQRPCEATLETQTCLCLVTVIILLSITDDGCVSQLKPLISPARLLRVLQLLAEEVAHDSSPYELVAGVDKVAWWLQAQRGAVSMAPSVLAVVAEATSSVRASKHTSDGAAMDAESISCDEEGAAALTDSEDLLKRGLECAAAWFKLGVLLMLPRSSYEGVIEETLHSAASPRSAVATAACDALAEAFERCPDSLLVRMQPQLLALTMLAVNAPRSISEQHQYQLLSLLSTYVQSSADSLVAGGRSDLLQQLFVAAGVRCENAAGDLGAAHAVSALVATSRAIQAAVKEEGGAVLPAHLQGLLHVCLEGAMRLLHVLQATLEACVAEPSQLHACLLEQLRECYEVLIPQIGASTFCQGLAEVQSAPQATSEPHTRSGTHPPIAAMLMALSSAPGALQSCCRGSPAAQANPSIARGLLKLMEQCREQATHRGTSEAASIAAHSVLFAAVPVFAPLQCAEASEFAAAAPMIAAAALQVLRTCPVATSGSSNGVGAAAAVHQLRPASPAPFHNHMEQDAAVDGDGDGDASVGMEADGQHRMQDIRARTPQSSEFMNVEDSAEGSGMHVLYGPASVAVASLVRALRGTGGELTIVDEAVVVASTVQLPQECDESLLLAAFTASVQAAGGGAALAVPSHGTSQTAAAAATATAAAAAALSQDSGLVGVAWRLVVAVAQAAEEAVQQMAALLQPSAGTHRQLSSSDGACMDTQPSGATLSSSAAGAEGAAAGNRDELLAQSSALLRHLSRAAAILQASRASTSAESDTADSDPDCIDLAEAPQPPAVTLYLLSKLAGVAEPLAAVLSSQAVSAAVAAPLRRVWGKATMHAIALDARAAEVLLPCVFRVVAEAASVDVLVDWHDLLAAMLHAYLPRAAGFSHTAGRILTALQTVWTLSELQALPCPGEADMIPEVSVASSMLCMHVARAALTPMSFLSVERVVPLIEVGMARCAMAASASLRQVAAAALSALLSMLSAAACLPESCLSPVAGCVLRGGGTIMMGFACALTAPGASNRVTKLTQLLLQLAALVARAVPLLSQPPLVALPHLPGLSVSMPPFPASQPAQGPGNTPLSPAAVTQGVAYVLLWLKHALACLRPGMLQASTPESICAVWQPLLLQALLAGIPTPLSLPAAAAPVVSAPGAVWQAVVGHAFPGTVEGSAGLPGPSPALPAVPGVGPPQQCASFAGSASPFVGLPAAAAPISLPLGAYACGSLGAGVRFGSALRADIPFAAQLTASMITAAAPTDAHSGPPGSEAVRFSDVLASAACRSLKKAVRSVVTSVGGRFHTSPAQHLGHLLPSSMPAAAAAIAGGGPRAALSGMRAALPPQPHASPQQVFAQQAVCMPGGPLAQPAFPFVPHVIAGAVAPAQLHVPVGSPHMSAQPPPALHPVAPATVAVAAAPAHAAQATAPLSAPMFAAPAAAPTAYFSSPAFPADPVLSAQPVAVPSAVPPWSPLEAQAMMQCSVAGVGGPGYQGLSMAPLAQQLQAVAIAGPASDRLKPFLGMETDENAR